MKGKSFVLGVLVLVALGLFAYFEIRKDEQTGKMSAADLVFPHNSSRVTAFSITVEDRSARFERGSGGGWEPLEGKEHADTAFVGDVLQSWARIRFIDVIEESPEEEDLSRFGLDDPTVVIDADLRPVERDDETSARIEIGAPLPLSPGYYARVDGFERVVAITPDAAALVLGVGRESVGLESLETESAPGA